MSDPEKPRTARPAGARLARWTRRIVLAVVAFVLLWTAAGALLLSTPAGLQLLQAAGERISGGALRIGHVHGSVLGGFEATSVRWRGADGERVSLARLRFEWHPMALLHGSVQIDQVELDGLHVVSVSGQRPQPASHKPPRIPASLPLNVRIRSLVVKDFRVADGAGKPLLIPQARLAASWVGRTIRIDRLDAVTAYTGPLHLSGRARTHANSLDIGRLQITGPGRLRVTGTLGYGATASDLAFSLSDLEWPLTGEHAGDTVRDLNGSAKLTGTLEHYALQVQLRGRARGRELHAELRGDGTPDAVKLARVHLAVDGNGSVDGHGRVHITAPLAADLDVTLAHLNPAPLAPDFPGDLNGRVRLQTTTNPAAGTSTIHFNAGITGSQLRHQPLTVDGAGVAELDHDKWRVAIDRLSATLGTTQLSAAGRVTPPFAVHGTVRSADLSTLDPALAGQLQAEFKLSGTLERPILDSRGSAAGLQLGENHLGHAQWDVQLDVPGHSKFTTTLENARLGDVVISRVRLRGDGTTADHQLHLTLRAPQADLSATLAGGYDLRTQGWHGALTALNVTPKLAKGLPAWHLLEPARLAVAASKMVLESTCLGDGSGKLCLQAKRTATAARAAFTLAGVQLANFDALWPERVRLEGTLDGSGHLQWRDAQLSAQARLAMTSGRVSVDGVAPVEILPSHVRVNSGAQGVEADIDLVTRHGHATATLHAATKAGLPRAQSPLSGTVSLAVPDIAFLEPFVADRVTHLGGKVDGRLTLAGTVGTPRIAGQVRLVDGKLTLPDAGVTFSAVSLAMTGNDESPLTVSGAASSGGGTLRLSGTVDATRWPVAVDLHLAGQDVEVFSTADARVWVSPDLQLVRDTSGLDLRGSILVPHAMLTPRSGIGGGHGGVAVSPDQVIVGAPPKKKVPEPRINVQLALILGDKVSFDGFGLKTRIAGGVVVTQKPSSPALARGQIYLVDGRYKAYGQDLTIDTGRLIFDGGPVTRPAIDIVATRKPRADIKVGVQVRGTLDKPKLTLTSSPAMPQQQQLSWLLFGHSLDQGSSGDQSAIAAATLSLALGGGDYLANRIGKHLGIDEISIGTPVGGGSAVATNANTISGSMAALGYGTNEAQRAAELTIGKYLTPRLYVSYGVSLFRPGQVFRLLYDLGHGFKLQTESGVSNGGDLLYTFEAGH